MQYKLETRFENLTVWVVDFDGQVEPYRNTTPIVGPAITHVVEETVRTNPEALGYTIRSPADFDHDPWAVRQSVYDEHAYAAIIINANATALLQGAVTGGNTSYDPYGAAEFVIISARDESTYYNYILPEFWGLEQAVRSYFGPRWIQNLTSSTTTNLTQTPAQALNPAIGFTQIDLRFFGPAVISPATSIGLIYLIILAFFNTPFMMPVHLRFLKTPNSPALKIPQWLLWRIASNIGTYFCLSLFYSFVSLAFQIPFTNPPASPVQPADNPNAYGHGSFVVYWMLNWVGMCALGFPCENMAMIIGFPWSSLFLIFWVITNVATGFYALDLAPGFFRWGYAWPLHRSTFLFSLPLSRYFALVSRGRTILTPRNKNSRRSPPHHPLRHALAHRPRFRGALHLDRPLHPAVPLRRQVHAVEAEARVGLVAWLRSGSYCLL